jgi:chromatin segregation and condensation protein Rec8/ScpA/Scc1 (kleisin family)
MPSVEDNRAELRADLDTHDLLQIAVKALENVLEDGRRLTARDKDYVKKTASALGRARLRIEKRYTQGAA